MKTKDCQVNIARRHPEKALAVNRRLSGNSLVKLGFDEKTAIKEAERCLGNVQCESCDLCRIFCPDLCITRNKNTGQIEIDDNYCKGCGICAMICPKGAIRMVLEE